MIAPPSTTSIEIGKVMVDMNLATSISQGETVADLVGK